MKADAVQQRTLAQLVDLDAELARLTHRRATLPEARALLDSQAAAHAARDRLAVLQLAIDDLDAAAARWDSEIDVVRAREERDRRLIDAGSVPPKQVLELQHELEMLASRRSDLEESLLEVMEQRETHQGELAAADTAVAAAQADLHTATHNRDDALADIDALHADRSRRRAELTGAVGAEVFEIYERQRAATGVGAGRLQGRRCGACRIELDRGELARITAADADEVLRCPECRALVLRIER